MAFISNFLWKFSFLCFMFLPVYQAKSVSFSFPNFPPDTEDILFQGDAFIPHDNDAIQLTGNGVTHSVGRALYFAPIQIWNSTGAIADFTSNFSFIVKNVSGHSRYGDGLAFFLAPWNSEIPPDSSGGYLGLFSPDNALIASVINKAVAVEFDSFSNDWDPSDDHVAIDVNTIRHRTSTKWNSKISSGGVVNANVTYESATMNLSVRFEDPADNNDQPYYHSETVDLSKELPEWVEIGFSGATGDNVQTNTVLSWEFALNL